MEYEISVEPFVRSKTAKAQALKPLEEAAEVFGAWQKPNDVHKLGITDDSNELQDVFYECCDTIQAACNLMASLGANPSDVMYFMGKVHKHNVERGRYGAVDEKL